MYLFFVFIQKKSWISYLPLIKHKTFMQKINKNEKWIAKMFVSGAVSAIFINNFFIFVWEVFYKIHFLYISMILLLLIFNQVFILHEVKSRVRLGKEEKMIKSQMVLSVFFCCCVLCLIIYLFIMSFHFRVTRSKSKTAAFE